jgi:RNase P subunit RPR2
MRNVREKVIKTSVRESISTLISKAESEFDKRPDLSKRYAKMAWELVKKNKVRLTSDQKLHFCRRCYTIWIPGKTATVKFDPRNNLFTIECKCGYSRKAGPAKLAKKK